MKEMNLPPFAPVLMESTRALGYSLEAAIADIIDNSISAQASLIQMFFMPLDNPYFAIIDNGIGMTEEELNNAMRYGSRHPNDIRTESDLGRFGLGLKTASLSQCRTLTVVTYKEGALYGRRWDLDIIHDRGEWILLILSEDEIYQLPHIEDLIKSKSGTLVLWNSLDRFVVGESSIEEAFNKKIPLVREHLSLVFHRYLQGENGIKKIDIFINENPLIAKDPFLLGKSYQILDDEYIYIDNNKIVIKPFILPHIGKMTSDEIHMLGGKEGLKKQQGFYIYRNKRLLVWGTWFRLTKIDDLSKLARVMVDIPNTLDEQWTLDVRKSTAIPPDMIKQSLRRIVDKIVDGSKRVWTTRGRKETDTSKILMWQRFKNRDGSVQYDINRDYPLIDLLKSKIDKDSSRELEQLLRLIELNLPVNALRVDFGNDRKVSFDASDELMKIVKNTAISIISTSDNPEKIAEILMNTDPFSNYPELIQSILWGEK